MIDTLLRALDLRTGRFTSPHVERMTERISVDGEPLSDEEFVAAFNDVAPYTHLVDAERGAPAVLLRDGRRDGLREVRGGAGRRRRRRGRDGRLVGRDQRRRRARWPWCCRSRSTTPSYLGDTPAEIAVEKAGIIKPGSVAVLAEQTPEVAEVLLARVAEVGATVVREGMDFGVVARTPGRRRPGRLAAGAAGAVRRACSCRCTAPTRPRTPPSPWPRSRRSSADASRSTTTLVRAAFAEVTSPGRLEIIRRSPTILLDAAHNPHGAEATAAALEDSFTFSTR